MFKVFTLPLLASVFIHGVIVAIVLIDMPNSEPLVKKATPKFIKAELVKLEETKTKPKAKPAPKKKPEPVKKKPDIAKKEADEAAKEKARQQKLAKEQEEQRKLKEEQARAEKEKQEKQEQERLKREREIKEEAERELAEAIAAEEGLELQAGSDEALVNSITAQINAVIVNNWSRPPSARNNMEAILSLQLVPTGEVVSVAVIKSSGNAAFDRSAEQAVRRAARFPELQQLPIRVFEQNFRRFRLKFRPEDLRL